VGVWVCDIKVGGMWGYFGGGGGLKSLPMG
jgi:hypothetical protein